MLEPSFTQLLIQKRSEISICFCRRAASRKKTEEFLFLDVCFEFCVACFESNWMKCFMLLLHEEMNAHMRHGEVTPDRDKYTMM